MSDLTHRSLWEEYQHLFAKSEPDGLRHPIEFGFDVGPGWLALLQDTLSKIASVVARMSADEQRCFRITQIKEKFGELRIYYTPHLASISRLIFEAAQHANDTCDSCGGFGMLFRIGTYFTIKCYACAEALALERGKSADRTPKGEDN